jgi:regulator of sigma E protease
VIAKCGKDANEMTDSELEEHGISETEYSIRLLPIGGFVSMLGQEDGKPDQISEDPRSYNRCSIGKRMVVVSAGVMMNILLAIVFFLICFQIGVNFEAPIIGQIVTDSPAARAVAQGKQDEHLQTGDEIVSIDGKETKTFQDIQIAGAMAKPEVPVTLQVRKKGSSDLLTYLITPESVTESGLLELGLFPSSSATIRKGSDAMDALVLLQEQYPELVPLRSGMKMESISFLSPNRTTVAITQWEDLQNALDRYYSDGTVCETMWSDGATVHTVQLPVFPSLEILRPVGIPKDAQQNFEFGFMGLVPLSKVTYVIESSPNANLLQKEDVLTQIGALEFPRMGQLRNYLATQPDGEISLRVLRGGDELDLTAELHDGKLGIFLGNALEVPIIAQPLEEVLVNVDGTLRESPTPISGKQLLGGSRFASVNNWVQLQALLSGTIPVTLQCINPTHQGEIVTIELDPSPAQHDAVVSSGWSTPLSQQLFEPIYVTRSSGGNPIKAIQMGFDETIDMIVMTYLTIDRLFRQTVGVDQLRGPVGIIHIGSKIADRGMSYLLFFLAIISVNLAVLNFLPLPIVDGGLFLYLIYEKLFKKPPSIAFQNAAAMFGLGLIATLFIVTFYNDIARLVG